MKRRDVLGAVTGVLPVLAAGCASPVPGSGAETTDVPKADDLAFDARVVDGSPTESPPRVAVELTNGADYGVRFTDGTAFPFTNFTSVGGDLYAIPPGVDGVSPLGDAASIVPDDRGDCWRATTNWKVIDIAVQKTLSPGESAPLEFDVLAAADTESCPTEGSYAFQNELLATDARNENRDGPEQQFTLQFTVERGSDGELTAASGTVM
jgi:hypothetical protein